MKKHKIFLYPLEENGKVRVFLFQSGDIGADRGISSRDVRLNGTSIFSNYYPEVSQNVIVTNGQNKDQDFKIATKLLEKEEFDKLKELEYAYNNR